MSRSAGSFPRKLRINVTASLVGFMLVGVSGLVMILAIAKFYPPEILGTFNLVYSIYLLLSQLVGAGIHFSVLRYIAEIGATQPEREAVILQAGIVATVANSLVWISLFLLVRPLLLPLFNARDLGAGLWYVTPALFFCGLNKVFLNLMNGKEEFVASALMNSIRALLLIALIVGCVVGGVEGAALPVVISVAEGLLFVILAIYLRKVLFASVQESIMEWSRKHLWFGYRSVVGSIFIDVNTRVDVLVLGLFSSAAVVGVYSYVAMLAEGFSQLAIVFRTLINPKLTHARFHQNSAALQAVAVKGRNFGYLILVPLGMSLVVLYIPMVNLFGLSPEFEAAFVPFAVLMTGLLVGIGYAPLLMIFNQVGMPLEQSKLYIFIFISNLLFNLSLVPFFGMQGSALGTALSYVATAGVMKAMVRRKLGISI